MSPIKIKNVLNHKENIKLSHIVLNDKNKNTILITGGIDGDEYAGINAAHKLIDELEKIRSDYRIIVVPLVNIFGNKNNISFNPIDGKYLKYIYPGRKDGTSSEQLIYKLEGFINECFLWIDLHSGSTEERLKPFIWAWQTKNKKLNELTLSFLSKLSNETIVYQRKPTKKVKELAKRNISYLMLESGELGEENESDTLRLVKWVKKLITEKSISNELLVYRNVRFYYSNKSGQWKPESFPGRVSQNQLIGALDENIINSVEGFVLYTKKEKLVNKREELFAIACEKELI